MRFLAISAAVFIWMQSALCLAEAFPTSSPGEEIGHEHQQAEPAGKTGHHGGEGEGQGNGAAPVGEDHCDLLSRTLTSAAAPCSTPAPLMLHASTDPQVLGSRISSLSPAQFLRAPTKAPDLIIQNASFLL
ncbi:MAG: hypothetical protein O6851_01015 [Gemmatimonadetes bacterium]|nr:hypothetical protein [Gemmatimonadota bacterium]